MNSWADIFYRSKLKLLGGFVLLRLKVHVSEKLIGLFKIDAFKLIEEVLFSLDIDKGHVMLNEMVLVVLFNEV